VGYTRKNIRESEDMAAKHGLSEFQEARFPYRDLDAEATGFGLIAVKPGKRQPFAHKHGEAEEVYLVLSGSGTLKLDDELIEIGQWDAVRIDPEHARSVEAGPDGIEVLAFGPRHEGDSEMVEGFWDD
jgi:mannose-6-phosphate isomerase-like protein (cupin superfamily)